ncbi:MAG: tryptophan synthase subunit alpha [Elusimicrobia bacterium]|nr:tryptophan synthase subunit alpha [Elusimicrobiota bacterium]MDE2512194.1 tryptophan synthase subunit alpha [Elusimicrobiota bacterium]
MPVTPLSAVLASRRASGRSGFVPFLVAGDPSAEAAVMSAKQLADAGADILEVGVPFSDPVADGPVIQAAGQRALSKGMTLPRAAGLVKKLRHAGVKTPVILFTYLNPVLRLGPSAFARLCADSNVSAALIVDLPVEEAGALAEALAARGIEIVLLASPTTTDQRLRAIGRASGSIVYYVSREGVTGVRAGLAPGLAARLAHVKALTGKPLIVGFGVAEPAQARALAPHAAGVVVGSALVNAAAKGGPHAVGRLARRLVAALEVSC